MAVWRIKPFCWIDLSAEVVTGTIRTPAQVYRGHRRDCPVGGAPVAAGQYILPAAVTVCVRVCVCERGGGERASMLNVLTPHFCVCFTALNSRGQWRDSAARRLKRHGRKQINSSIEAGQPYCHSTAIGPKTHTHTHTHTHTINTHIHTDAHFLVCVSCKFMPNFFPLLFHVVIMNYYCKLVSCRV